MSDAFGLLNIDKPQGYTSHDIVNIVRKRTGVKKVGHAGTLDPLATGVLVLCMGAATRLSEYIMGHTKTYVATLRLGAATDTYDSEGTVTAESDAIVTQDQLEAVLPTFRGSVQQVPPMYSAVKKGGKKLYELARQGEDIERDPRQVSFYKIELQEFDYPSATLLVRCSPGTYIRSLAHDIGGVLGVGAHLTALRRISSGENFTVDNAISLADFEEAVQNGTWLDHLLSVRLGLSELPYIELNNQQEAVVRNGGSIQLGISNQGLIQAWTDEGVFVAIMSRRGEEDSSADWKPDKVLLQPEN